MRGIRTVVLVALVTVGLAACDFARSPFPLGSGSSGSSGSVATAAAVVGPKIGGCPVFPASNAWNQNVSKLPVRSDSATLVRRISQTGGKTMLHPDFGGDGAYGIPFKVVVPTSKRWPIHYTAYGNESDPGPFPIPSNTPVEGAPATGGDRHVIVVQQSTCHLFELYRAFWRGTRWDAASGANWNLKSNAMRPDYRFSPDSRATTK
jgi:hypothetical protein